MTQQIADSFIWNNKKWVFIGADDIYSLFDPEKYGLSPTEPNTACWKGFIIQFRITEEYLFLDKLLVYCDNNVYPPINGVNPTLGDMYMQCYENINMKLSYSGIITIGRKMKPEFYDRAFTGAHSYETTYELTIKDGKLINSKETSGTYFGI